MAHRRDMTRILQVAALLAAFACAVALRVAVGGAAVAQSYRAGLVFAAALILLAVAGGTRVPVSARAVLAGVAGAAVVCAPVALGHLASLRPLHGTDGFLPWVAVVTVVAGAEELFLRGTLYDATHRLAGSPAAVALGAICFALLHVPLYGWHVLPLDFAVGLVLGGLRHATGTPAAPAVTHVLADVAGWFLR